MKTVYICSPSAPFNSEKYDIEKGKSNLEKLGFQVEFSLNFLANTGNTAGSIQQRVSDLHDGLFNQNVDIILPTRGGFNSNEILPFLDFAKIKEHSSNKIFCGYSDNTTLVNNLHAKSNLQTIYGLNFGNFCSLEIEDLLGWKEVINNPEFFSTFHPKSKLEV